LSPDGKKAATTGADGRIRFWNPSTGAELSGCDGHGDALTGVVFLPGGKALVTAGLDGTLFWWDRAGKVNRRVDVAPGETSVLALSPDGGLLATGGREGIVRLWDADKGTKVSESRGPRGPIRCLAFSADGKLMASASPAAQATLLVLWDVSTGKDVRRLEGLEEEVQSIAFSPTGKHLAAVSKDEGVHRWDVGTGRALPPLVDNLRDVTRLTYLADGKLLVGGFGGSRSVVLWNDAGKKTAEFEEEGSAILGIVCTSDGQTIATAHGDNAVRLWEVRTGKERHVIQGHLAPLRNVALSPNGRLLATASSDQTVLIWDLLASPDAGRERLTVDRMQALWRDLGENDAHRAYDAICTLAGAPQSSLRFLGPRLGALPKLDEKQIERWVANLDARSFKAREEAMDNLGRLGRLVEEQLRKGLEGKPTLELRRRIEELLRRLPGAGQGEEWKQLGRAIEILEQIGTEPARRLLEKLADGGDYRPTREARAALERLKRRP
jgi:dipeptidyl aminopeptidase/acylaminoacyl peptidase